LDGKAAAALARAKRFAHSLDGVQGVDFGYAYRRGKRRGLGSVRFHVKRKFGMDDLQQHQRIPKTIGGVDVDVIVATYRPHNGNPRGPQTVVVPGISIGNAKTESTGTLGGLVRDNETSRLAILSNWHVLCGTTDAAAGDEICQPGPMDTGSSLARPIATVDKWLPLTDQLDAAIAYVNDGVTTGGNLFGTDFHAQGTAAPAVGMHVVKSGAATGVTSGVVDGIGGSYNIDYTQFGDKPEWMSGFRIVPNPTDHASSLSLDGDSGSFWLDSASNNAVGLHFAGEDDDGPLNEYALAHSLDAVLQRLNVTLVTQ
jgi:hypothetical protein